MNYDPLSSTLNSTDVARLRDAIEYTLLAPTATGADVEALCAGALRHGVTRVCVSPTHVAVARAALPASCRVVSVCGFPSGAHDPAVKAHEAALAHAAGAAEIDVVLDLARSTSGSYDRVFVEVDAVRRAVPEATLKLILETAAIGFEPLETIAAVAAGAGVEFLKTSTGFHPAGGATIDAVAALVQLSQGRYQVKASGGIRTAAAALGFLDAGATRIGASSLLEIPPLHAAEAAG